MRRCVLVSAEFICGSCALASIAYADDPPKTISPLLVEPDRNSVNLVTGKTTPDALVLSVPAAPRLKFDRVQNAAPYVKSDVTRNFDTGDEMLALSTVHTMDGTSETFRCDLDPDAGKACGASLNGTGSMVNYGATKYRRGGSGELYALTDVYEYTIPNPGDIDQKTHKVFYASTVTYPDGEVISYTYNTANLAGVTLHRPITLSSNRGYYISINYPCDDPNQTCWYQPSQAAIYKASNPNSPLARYTYNSDGTVTDLMGRVFSGYDPGELGVKVEVASYSRTLPTETSAAINVTAASGLPSGAQMVGSVSRDGVAWNYAYTNPAYYDGIDGYLYDNLNVTGPNGYHKNYTMAHTGALSGIGTRNLISSVTDELNHQTNYEYELAANVNGSDVRLKKITYPEGNAVSISYDDAGNVVTKTTIPKAGSGLSNIVEQAFVDLSPYYLPGASGYLNCVDTVACYRPTWYKDALNRETDFRYNANGQLTKELDPADQNGVQRLTYVTYGTSTAGISRKTLVQICQSSSASIDTAVCSGNAASHTEYTYWGDTDLPLTVVQKDEATGGTRTTTYAYDTAGRQAMTDGPLSGTDDAKYFQYDILGRKIWEVGERGPNGLRLAKKYTYRDSDDKVVSVQAGTVSCTSACDTANLTLTVLQQSDTTYDSRRYPIRETTYKGTTTYAVTDRSFLDRGLADCTTVRMNLAALPAASATGACTLGTQGTQGPDRITKNLYDAAGELTSVQKAFATSLQQIYVGYTYTANGKQQTVTDANGNKAQFVYDGLDRLSQWQFPSKTTAGQVNTADYEQYAYDAASNRTCLRKRDGSKLTYAFDGLNRVMSKVVAATSGGNCP
jgi:YD repeat-containing protein